MWKLRTGTPGIQYQLPLMIDAWHQRADSRSIGSSIW